MSEFWLQGSRKQSKPPSSLSTISLQIADCAEKMSGIIVELLFLANPLAQPIYVNLPSVSLWPLSPPDVLSFPSDMKSFQHHPKQATLYLDIHGKTARWIGIEHKTTIKYF